MTTSIVTFSNKNFFFPLYKKALLIHIQSFFYWLSRNLLLKITFCHSTYKNYLDSQVAVNLIILLIMLTNLSALISKGNCLIVLISPHPLFCTSVYGVKIMYFLFCDDSGPFSLIMNCS